MGLADGISIQPVIEVQSSVVKVVVVGGCGGNVAQHVYDTGLRDVSLPSVIPTARRCVT